MRRGLCPDVLDRIAGNLRFRQRLDRIWNDEPLPRKLAIVLLLLVRERVPLALHYVRFERCGRKYGTHASISRSSGAGQPLEHRRLQQTGLSVKHMLRISDLRKKSNVHVGRQPLRSAPLPDKRPGLRFSTASPT